MGFDWQSEAWRDGYDEWKTRLPDWWDDEPEEETEPQYERKTPRRHFLIDEAQRRAEVNHARNGALELRRANDHLRRILKYPRNPNAVNLKRFARSGIAEARRQRTLIGPMYPFDLMPFEAEMTDSTHTPGPWSHSDRAVLADNVHIIAAYLPHVGPSGEREAIANARLAAAAPDLVVALRAFLNIAAHCEIKSGVCGCGEEMQGHSDPYSAGHSPTDMADQVVSKAIADAEAALAKAEGRS